MKRIQYVYVLIDLARYCVIIQNMEVNYPFISFIDDDDLVSEEYVDQVLRKIRKNPDVVTFWGYRFHNGKKDRPIS